VIKIEQHAGPDRKKVLDRFDLDMGGCIECALCVEACPFRAITMAPDFEMATYDRSRSLVFNMHELRIAGTPEVDLGMEYIQGVKRGLAGQAARGEPGAARPAAGARPAAAGAGARPAAGAGAAKPAAAGARSAAAAGPARPPIPPAENDLSDRARPSEPREGNAKPADLPGGGPEEPAPVARPAAQAGPAVVEASSGTVDAPDAERPLPTEPRSAEPGTEQAGQTPAATPAAHPAAAPEAVDQQPSGPPKPPPQPSGPVPMTPTRMRLGTGRGGAPRAASPQDGEQ
jgi:ferredoxin